MSRSPTTGSTEAAAAATVPERIVVSVDTGGTFTDLVMLGRDGVRTLKVPSTPDDPGRAILEGLRQLMPGGGAFTLLHGSTVATNALLERQGGRVVLITNAGFEDVIEIGRQNRPQLYALTGHRPPPLVERRDRVGISGRLASDGSELQPVDPDHLNRELESAFDRLADADAIAICLLHSYADGTHEEAVAEGVRALFETEGETPPPISLSSRILPEFREFERTSTTVVNAYVAERMSSYLGALRQSLEEGLGELVAERLAVMGSAGGLLSLDRAMEEPVHTILSGPAGGVVGARAWAERVGQDQIITFDMGGTSTDVALCPGRELHTREFEIAGSPVSVPVLDIHTVGAGGGSIAWVDPGGALRVGPRSAGAQPGPICYSRGGRQVTVTDAHVWLGRLPADAFLGGESKLDRDAIEGPLRELADRMGLSLEKAAEGVLEVANATMERALRVTSVERGWDPAGFSLVAFGGAGALHAAELAGRLGCAEALIPPSPGLLSAFGILVAPPRREASRTLLRPLDPDDPTLVEELEKLQATAHEGLTAEGVEAGEIEMHRWVDARYAGQSFELRVPADGDPAAWRAAFDGEHERRYGYARPDRVVECVTLRAVATAGARDLPDPTGSDPSGGDAGISEAPISRSARIWLNGEATSVPVLDRSQLQPGEELEGPSIVADYSSTTWIPEGWRGVVHGSAVLRLVPEGETAIL